MAKTNKKDENYQEAPLEVSWVDKGAVGTKFPHPNMGSISKTGMYLTQSALESSGMSPGNFYDIGIITQGANKYVLFKLGTNRTGYSLSKPNESITSIGASISTSKVVNLIRAKFGLVENEHKLMKWLPKSLYSDCITFRILED